MTLMRKSQAQMVSEKRMCARSSDQGMGVILNSIFAQQLFDTYHSVSVCIADLDAEGGHKLEDELARYKSFSFLVYS
jgi:hypothetical protein